jgi:hypothetical protein
MFREQGVAKNVGVAMTLWPDGAYKRRRSE